MNVFSTSIMDKNALLVSFMDLCCRVLHAIPSNEAIDTVEVSFCFSRLLIFFHYDVGSFPYATHSAHDYDN